MGAKPSFRITGLSGHVKGFHPVVVLQKGEEKNVIMTRTDMDFEPIPDLKKQ